MEDIKAASRFSETWKGFQLKTYTKDIHPAQPAVSSFSFFEDWRWSTTDQGDLESASASSSSGWAWGSSSSTCGLSRSQVPMHALFSLRWSLLPRSDSRLLSFVSWWGLSALPFPSSTCPYLSYGRSDLYCPLLLAASCCPLGRHRLLHLLFLFDSKVLSFCSIGFMIGWDTYFNQLTTKERLPIFIYNAIMIIATICLSFRHAQYIVILIFSILELVGLFSLLFSLVPGGIYALSSMANLITRYFMR